MFVNHFVIISKHLSSTCCCLRYPQCHLITHWKLKVSNYTLIRQSTPSMCVIFSVHSGTVMLFSDRPAQSRFSHQLQQSACLGTFCVHTIMLTQWCVINRGLSPKRKGGGSGCVSVKKIKTLCGCPNGQQTFSLLCQQLHNVFLIFFPLLSSEIMKHFSLISSYSKCITQ